MKKVLITILVILIIGIGAGLGYVYYNFDKKINEQNEKIDKVLEIENSIDNLNNQVNKLVENEENNVSSENDSNSSVKTDNNSSSENTLKEGKYVLTPSELEEISYTFEDGTVTYESLEMYIGTYTVSDGEVNIKYEKAYDPDGEEMELSVTEETLTIDGDTLKSEDATYELQ